MFPKYLLYGGGGKQWDVMIHNGPMFAPLYEPHNIPVTINGSKHQLAGLAEEYMSNENRAKVIDFCDNFKIEIGEKEI